MRTIKILKFIFCILFFLIVANHAYGERYNEDVCFKDYVEHKDQNVVLAINRDTDQVEQYWSDKDQTWLKPDKDYQETLQKLYNKKIQLREMQKRLDAMRYDTIYNTNQNTGAHR